MATKNLIRGANNFSTNLTSDITSSATTIELDDVTGLPTAQGILVIDRVDSSGTATPTTREFIRYSSISGNNVVLDDAPTGRAFGGSTAQAHSAGAVVESVPTAENLDYFMDSYEVEHNDDGTHKRTVMPGVDGWIEVADTWAYASATTITVPSGAASLYQKGDKIKITQITAKYFYIVGVADTVLTVTGGSDYTVADAAITSPYYSHDENPIGFPTSFAYTVAEAGWSASEIVGRFSVTGNVCNVYIYMTSGTSDAAVTTLSLPVTAKTVAGMVWVTIGQLTNSGTPAAGVINVSSGSSTMRVLTIASANPASSGGKTYNGQCNYEI